MIKDFNDMQSGNGNIFSKIKELKKELSSVLVSVVALVISLFNIKTGDIQNNFIVENLLSLSITFSITMSIVLNFVFNINFTTNNYNLYTKDPAFIAEDTNILNDIKEVLEPITYFFIDRNLSLPWPSNIFNKLFIFENTLKLPSYNFANIELQNVKLKLHEDIDRFTTLVVINEDLENGMFCSRYYWFSKNELHYTGTQKNNDKNQEDDMNKALEEMLSTYSKLLTMERKILEEHKNSI